MNSIHSERSHAQAVGQMRGAACEMIDLIIAALAVRLRATGHQVVRKAGGCEGSFDRWRDLMEVFSKRMFCVRPPGHGAERKLV